MGLLVLTRKQNERLIIGGTTVIEVLSIRGGKVRLGIDADKSVKVMREEIISDRKESK